MCQCVLASAVVRNGAPFLFLACSVAVVIVSGPQCPVLCFPLIQELANCGLWIISGPCSVFVLSTGSEGFFKGLFKKIIKTNQRLFLQLYLCKSVSRDH